MRLKSYPKITGFAILRGYPPNFISVRLDTGRVTHLRSALFLCVKTQTSCNVKGQHLKGHKAGVADKKFDLLIAGFEDVVHTH